MKIKWFLDKLKTELDFPEFEFNKKFNAEISVNKETRHETYNCKYYRNNNVTHFSFSFILI